LKTPANSSGNFRKAIFPGLRGNSVNSGVPGPYGHRRCMTT